MQTRMSRRNFLQGVGVTAAGFGAAAALAGCSTSTEETDTTEAVESADVVTTELEIPKWDTPEITSYECDVLVVGGGWAGVASARGCIDNGMSVVVADKGRPGFSGLTAWSNSFCWFDPDYDDGAYIRNMYRIACEYACNLNWLDVWIDNSKAAYEEALSWGVLEQYANCNDTDVDYGTEGDTAGYLQDFVTTSKDRHWQFRSAIVDYGAQLAEQTMITDVIEDEGRIVGAVGFHVPTATVISFACKAVIMATGAGCYKPCGYPTGSSTWDGDYIGYTHGVPMAGKEFADFHGTSNSDAGSCYNQWIGHYVQSNWLCSEATTPAGWSGLMTTGYAEALAGTSPWDPNPAEEGEESSSAGGPPAGSGEEETEEEDNGDIRLGELGGRFTLSDGSVMACGFAAPGMGIHKGEGAYTGNNATCATNVAGLYYCGDALSSSAIGTNYFGVGYSSCLSVTQGMYCASEVNEYVPNVDAGYITDEVLAEQTEIILAPLSRETGFDANWLRDTLQALMSNPTVSLVKNDSSMTAALTFIEQLRDTQLPLLAAVDGHELRLCHEMNAKVLHAEMKMRAGLARKESRGRHYRSDYPYRDDSNFLCQMILSQGSDGSMEVSTVDYDEDWIGDTSMDYAERYMVRFPNEQETLGFTEYEYDDLSAVFAARCSED